MIVSAISLQGIDKSSLDRYAESLSRLVEGTSTRVLVLPAHTALVLGLETKNLAGPAGEFNPGYLYNCFNQDWTLKFLDLHSRLARSLNLYLSPGTIIEENAGQRYQSAYCFNPSGDLCCIQHQTHLTRLERKAGLSRGEELNIFDCEGFKAGLIAGNDARHPEVGRILAFQGVDLVLHSGAIEGEQNCWRHVSGMWAQVQQNQFWAVEAQLSAEIGSERFAADSAVLAPCEITPGHSGYLARGYPHTSLVTAELDQAARQRIKDKYPILKLLNRKAYAELAVQKVEVN